MIKGSHETLPHMKGRSSHADNMPNFERADKYWLQLSPSCHALKEPMTIISRFAPSPTGALHLGHAYAAWLGHQRADIWHLRLEDIDSTRCKPAFAAGILEDLTWLGLNWEGEVRVQSAHFADYARWLETLQARDLLYPCFCTRGEIARAQSAPHAAEAIYPGTCRHLSPQIRQQRLAAGHPYALRLHTERACQAVGNLRFFDESLGWVTAHPQRFGDVVLARKDTPSSYHLCVVHDDALQGITHVIRGEDLLESTHIHVLLQRLMGVATPIYHHHKLLCDAQGQRLAKRNKAQTLSALRQSGVTPAQIWQKFGSAGNFE